MLYFFFLYSSETTGYKPCRFCFKVEIAENSTLKHQKSQVFTAEHSKDL